MKRPPLLQKPKWIILLLINWTFSVVIGFITWELTQNSALATSISVLLIIALSASTLGRFHENQRLGQILKENRTLSKRTLAAVKRTTDDIRDAGYGHGIGASTGSAPTSRRLHAQRTFPKSESQALSPQLIKLATRLGERETHPITGHSRDLWNDSRQKNLVISDSTDSFPYRTTDLPFSHDISIAMIADDFTYNSFLDEFDCHRLTPANWHQIMETKHPRMFFCESAWQGGPPAEHPWQGKVYASVRWPQENRTVLLDILEYCKVNSIPTVFWNKEDPVHFSDRINDFIRTAALFDYVFTTAEECISSYKRDVGVKNVDVLPFAVQPKLFNPISNLVPADTASFAGTWYNRYPDRCKSAGEIMDLVLSEGKGLDIYDRMYSSNSPNYVYPERFVEFTKPAITYQQTAEAYRSSKFGITLNTVTDSKTMFARRVFELAASGSVVLSNYSAGVDNFFGNAVIFADRDPEKFQQLDENGYRTLQRDAMEISLQHTYRHRAEKILTTVGIEHNSMFQKQTAIIRVENEREVQAARLYVDNNPSVFSALLIVVVATADQTLVTNLMRSPRRHETVVSQRQIDNHDYRSRNLMSTPGGMILSLEDEPLSHRDVRYLESHSSYAEHPIRLADVASDRFTTRSDMSLVNVFVRAEDFLATLASTPAAKTVYLV